MIANSTIRVPDETSPSEMTARGWILVVLNLLLPGSAQAVAAKSQSKLGRFLGRIGLISSITLWILVIVAVLVYFLNRNILIWIGTNSWLLLFIQIVLIGYAVLWVILTLDTLRMVRFIRVEKMHRPIIALFAFIPMVLLTTGVGYATNLISEHRGLLDELFVGDDYIEPVDGRYNILLLGGDAGYDRMGLRPDSLSVVSVDAETGELNMIGIPRNLHNARFAEGSPLWTDMPTGYDCGDECLISFLYTYGEEHPDLYPLATANASTPGIEATRDAVEGTLGIELQYYVLVDMAGFAQIIDALGGVTINVSERVPMATHMDANGNLTDLIGWIEPGEQVLDGNTALWYARSRVITNDYNRMERQRQVQQAIMQQFNPSVVLTKFQDLAAVSKATLKTDIPAGMLAKFVDIGLKSQEFGIKHLELVPPMINTSVPDIAKIQAEVDKFLSPPPAETSNGN